MVRSNSLFLSFLLKDFLEYFSTNSSIRKGRFNLVPCKNKNDLRQPIYLTKILLVKTTKNLVISTIFCFVLTKMRKLI